MKTVYIDMVGDLFHYGHVRMFQQALENGDRLIIGLMSDEECELYKRCPIMSLKERVEVINACEFVSLVVPDAPMPITKDFMDYHKIDVVCHGDDMSDKDLKYWYDAAIKENKFVKTKYTETVSTSQIIKRILDRVK